MNGTLNKVILIGNVGAEMKVHQFDNNDKIGRLPIATSESYTDRTTGERISITDWHNIVVRNKLVDVFEKYVSKGDKLYIEGKLKTRKYKDAEGHDRYATEIMVNEFTFLTPKSGQAMDASDERQQEASNESSETSIHPSSSTSLSEEEEGDLPF